MQHCCICLKYLLDNNFIPRRCDTAHARNNHDTGFQKIAPEIPTIRTIQNSNYMCLLLLLFALFHINARHGSQRPNKNRETNSYQFNLFALGNKQTWTTTQWDARDTRQEK